MKNILLFGRKALQKMSKKIVLFGAGNVGGSALSIIDTSKVAYFIDNDKNKSGTHINAYPIKHIDEVSVDELKGYHIIISISKRYLPEARKQLDEMGITDYESISDIMRRSVKENKKGSFDVIKVYERAKQWVFNNTNNEGVGSSIINNSNLKRGYPEVTGYCIPSLLRWGFRDLAYSYAEWLMSIQNKDGSFSDTEGKSPYIFDTAQAIKGLLAAKMAFGDKYDNAILKACRWIISKMNESGRLITPDITEWGNDRNLELIHLYCISPLYEAADVFGLNEFFKAADMIKGYYLNNYIDDIIEFKRLIHFHAYLMEALIDIGEVAIAEKGMKALEHFVDEIGYVPAYCDKRWVCSTGLFQIAICWYRLGNVKYGDKLFDYSIKLQNGTGGWYGSYITDDAEQHGEDNDYFPVSEISWANKFFFDALYYKLVAASDIESPNFQNGIISRDDGRYQVVENLIGEALRFGKKRDCRILDAGGGNGRYIKNLLVKYPNVRFHVVDISTQAILKLPENVEGKQGTLTNLPYSDDSFDVVYACESFEHAIDQRNAIRELSRVLKKDGRLLILDKTAEAEGEMETSEWEIWPGKEELLTMLNDFFVSTNRIDNISYDGIIGDDTFSAWIGIGKR